MCDFNLNDVVLGGLLRIDYIGILRCEVSSLVDVGYGHIYGANVVPLRIVAVNVYCLFAAALRVFALTLEASDIPYELQIKCILIAAFQRFDVS